MAISETIKINILVNKKYKDRVLDWLQEGALMQIEETDWMEQGEIKKGGNELTEKNAATEENIDYDLANVKFAIGFLAQFDETRMSLAEKLAGNKIKVVAEELGNKVLKINYKKIANECQNIEKGLGESKNQLEKIESERKILEAWVNLKISPNETETKKTKTVFGKINNQKYLDFLNKIEKESKEFAVEKIKTDERELAIMLTFSREAENGINKIFNESGFVTEELPYPDKRPREALGDILTLKHKNIKTNDELRNEAKKLAKEMKNLKIAFDWLVWRKAKKESESKFGATDFTYSISGWIEKINLKGIHNKLQKLAKNNVDIEITALTKKDSEQQPVVIRNGKFWKNFEAVTGIYGLPKEDEPDPTVFLAPFFIIYFGFCLTDAGYGIILAVAAWLAIKIMKMPPENQKLLRVLMYGGVSTFILGALFGGWFGITLDNLPNSAIKDFLISLRMIDPMRSPLLVLGITFGLGIIQVWTGIIISMWWQIKQKQYREALLSRGVWVYFIPTILFWVSGKIGILPQGLLKLSNVLILAGVAIMILTQGRKQKNIVAKLGAGVLSLYGLVGYLSDVLSYSRLLALGLGTGIIAMVVNLIAGLFKEMIPYVGWVVAILILVGGHAFNIVINVLGAFIHSGRLQFVEFFPKFMEGGGMRFRPLRRESKYVEIITNI